MFFIAVIPKMGYDRLAAIFYFVIMRVRHIMPRPAFATCYSLAMMVWPVFAALRGAVTKWVPRPGISAISLYGPGAAHHAMRTCHA